MVYMSITLCRSNLKIREEKEMRAVQTNAERNSNSKYSLFSVIEHPRRMMEFYKLKT